MDDCGQKEVDVLVSGLYFFLDLDLGVVYKKSDECFLVNPQQFLSINLEKFGVIKFNLFLNVRTVTADCVSLLALLLLPSHKL